ncbi:MAG: TrkA family potassium uptake protein [Chloroflexaceae bacterium]|nr:TrkA family potassium uptake protein [Chloroflexaceae bacterium]
MYIILVGAGDVSSFLIQMALESGHNVALIEQDEHLAQFALEQYDIRVFQASIGERDILREAGAEHADALIATTSDDATNLMAMFLGVEHTIPILISIVNERTHKGMFERLNAHVLVDPEAITARYLYRLLIAHRVEETLNLPGGETFFQTTLDSDSALIGYTPAGAHEEDVLPNTLLIVSLKRGDKYVVNPADDMTLEAGDQIIVFTPVQIDEDVLSLFRGS